MTTHPDTPTKAATKTPAEAEGSKRSDREQRSTETEKARHGLLEPVQDDSGQYITPAEQDKRNPPRNNDEAQAQAAAVDPSVLAGPGQVEPIAYQPPVPAGRKADDLDGDAGEPDFSQVAKDAINGVVGTSSRKVLNDNNTAIRLAISSGMGWGTDGVHRINVRVPANKDGDDKSLKVEVRKDYDDWETVTLDS